MSTIKVPRATMRPSERVVSLPSSSIVAVRDTPDQNYGKDKILTPHGLLHIVQHKVHELIVAFQQTEDYRWSVGS